MKHEDQHHHHASELCSCGHDHSEHGKSLDRLHEQEPCACGHDHQHPKLGHNNISITHHENAVIVSAEREISGDFTQTKETLTLGLKELADWVDNQNGLVGHIKAHLAEKGKSAMLSTTGDEVQVKEIHHPTVILNLAVIVFVADEDGLANHISAMIEKLS